MREQFFKTTYALMVLALAVSDRYLREKLVDKIKNFLFCFLLPTGETKAKDSVAQYREAVNKSRGALKDLEEYVDLLIHLKKTFLSPALAAKKELLVWRLSLVTPRKTKSKKKSETATKGKPTSQNITDAVIDLIKQRGGCQTKEIIYALKNHFSPRTVHRHLFDLCGQGVLIKKVDAGFSKYTLASI